MTSSPIEDFTEAVEALKEALFSILEPGMSWLIGHLNRWLS